MADRETQRREFWAGYNEAKARIDAGHDAPIALPDGWWLCHRCLGVCGWGLESCEGFPGCDADPEDDEPEIPDTTHAPVARPILLSSPTRKDVGHE
jgi:hypothetical protein